MTGPVSGRQVQVLARRSSTTPGVVWEARTSADRGRLEVVAIVTVGAERVEIPLLTTAQLLELLGESPGSDVE